MDLHPDFKDLLAEFARSKVSYALLGGYAVGYHAKPRATKDLDLLLSGLDDNLERAAGALAAFGAPAQVVQSCLQTSALPGARRTWQMLRRSNGQSARVSLTRRSEPVPA
jgi:hypothetical protein